MLNTKCKHCHLEIRPSASYPGRWVSADNFEDCPNDPVGRRLHEPAAPEAEPRTICKHCKQAISRKNGDYWRNPSGGPGCLSNRVDEINVGPHEPAEAPAVPPAQEEVCKCPPGCDCHHHAQPSPQPAGGEPPIKRYSLMSSYEGYVEVATGEWVSYVDHEAQLAALRKSQQAELAELNNLQEKYRNLLKGGVE